MQSDRLSEEIEAAQVKLDKALESQDDDAVHRMEVELSELRRQEERPADTEQDLLNQIKASRLSGDQVTTRRLEQQVAEQRAKRNKELGTAAEEEEKLPRVSLPGAVKALSHEKWKCLHYNSRSEMPVFREPPPCKTAHTSFPAELADEDFTSIVCAFCDEGFLLGYENAVKAALRVSTLECFDPVKDYLDALKWDGVERLPLFLWACFGANTDPEEEPGERAKEAKWISTISVKWPISAVARVYDAGCQVDTVLIAESPLQGTRKSSAFRALAVRSDWFASELPDIKHKDSVHHLLGPWIIELDELDALNRKEATSIKGFISRRVDRARLSYRKNTANYARRVVFCGTTNEDVYNSDATGGRRFWPFKVRETIDIDLIEQWRDQIWAEAVHRYKAKESWWFSDSELETIAHEEQSKRFKGGVHLDAIRDYLKDKERVSIDDILGALGIAIESRNQIHQNEVARALQHLGWRRRRVTEVVKGEKQRVWRYVYP